MHPGPLAAWTLLHTYTTSRLHGVMKQKTTKWIFICEYVKSHRPVFACYSRTWSQRAPPHCDFVRTTSMIHVKISLQSLIEWRTACTSMKSRSAVFVSCLISNSNSFPSFHLCLGFPNVPSLPFYWQNFLCSYLLVPYIYIYIYILSQ